MNSESCIFLAGASRGVGREIAKCLADAEIKVKAMLRSPETRPELEAMGIEVVMADALDAEAVERAFREGTPVRAAISTLGGVPQEEGVRVDYLGNRNLIDAAVKAEVEKFILISSIGCGNSAIALPPRAMETLKLVLAEKEKAEQHLIDSGLTYTIIRPGGLKSEPATGKGVLTEEYRVSGTIHRPDVATLACACLLSDKADNKILSAIDGEMAYGQTDFAVLDVG